LEQKRSAFVSYAREDESFALQLAADLKTKGANVWLDQSDIRPGQQWAHEVHQALSTCSEVLVILSPPAMESVHVRNEFGYALERSKRVIPVLHKQCDVHFLLASLHRIDFISDYEVGLKILLSELTWDHQVNAAITAAGADASRDTGQAGAELGQKAGDNRDVEPAAAPLPQPSSSRAWTALAVGTFLVLAAAGGGVHWWMSSADKPDAPVVKVTRVPEPEPAPPPAPAPSTSETTVPVVLGDAVEVRLTLAADIPSDAAEGDPVRFNVAHDLLAQETVVIPMGAEAIGAIVDGAKKHILGIGGKMTFSLASVYAVDGQKVRIRATPTRDRDGTSKRPVNTGAKTTEQVAAAAGSNYVGYIDTSNTVMVTRVAR
jgi:hypothetical protein